MRELVFKNLTSDDHKKRDIFVREIVEKDGILASSERRCLYFIKNKIEVTNSKDLAKLAQMKKDSPDNKRDFHVLKSHDSTTGADKLVCKLRGTFYAVVGKAIYCIVFFHSFKLKFKAVTPRKD